MEPTGTVMPLVTLGALLDNVGVLGGTWGPYIIVGVSLALAPVLIRTGLRFFRRGK